MLLNKSCFPENTLGIKQYCLAGSFFLRCEEVSWMLQKNQTFKYKRVVKPDSSVNQLFLTQHDCSRHQDNSCRATLLFFTPKDELS